MARKEQARKFLPPWPATALCVLLGMVLGRLVLPYPKFEVPDFSTLRRAAPTAPDYRAVLASDEALPESVANNLRLTHDECDAGFPLLWGEVTRTRDQFVRRGSVVGITLKDLQESEVYDGTRVAIVDNRMYVKRFHAESASRNQAVLASLYEAVSTAPEPMPDVEFWFRGTDNLVEGAHFGLNKEANEKVWLLPDFGFWSFWRGALLSKFREELYNLVQGYEWNDIDHLDWGTLNNRIEMEDHCKHRYLASIEGNSAYSGRLKYILQCRSVVVSHKMKWIQHFHPALDADSNSPDQNFVELQSSGWAELPVVMEDIIRDPVKSQRIADNAVRTMRGRYLTPASVTCYWRRVLAEYASLQQFVPTAGDGVDFQSFAMTFEVHWKPH
ncbi:hypothetical protein RQP46_004890 [Phenoliferia psychrophenolica]